MRARLRKISGDRGAAAVEFALVLIPLILIVFGIIDFGRAYNAQETLTQAARVGARTASLNATANITTIVKNAATDANDSLDAANLTVSSACYMTASSTTCGAAGTTCSTANITRVRVSVDYAFEYLALPIAHITISGSATAPC